MGNNPVGFVDPDGTVPLPVVTAGAGAVGGAVIGGAIAYYRGGNIWQGAGRGFVIGGLAGLGGGLGASLLAPALGGGTAATLATAALSAAAGDLTGQTAELAFGWRCRYQPLQTLGSAALGRLSVPVGRYLGGLLGLLCFTGETPVVLADGTTKPIREVKVGDRVLARDEGGGSVEARRVTQTFEREVDATRVLTFASEERIETTEEHPFSVAGRGSSRPSAWGSGPRS